MTCRGKSCPLDNWCDECHDWSEEHCRYVANYAEKLSAQHEKKKERKTKSSSSSFSVFSPTMPVPFSQLAPTTGASSTAVCAVMYSVTGPAVSAVLSMSTVAVVEQPWKRKRWTDPVERALAWENFQDCWASGRSTPSTGMSYAPWLLLVTPPVDPGSSSALAVPAAVVLSSSSRASSHHSRQSPRPCPVLAPTSLPDPAYTSSVRTGVALSDVSDPARSISVRTSVASSNIPDPARSSSVRTSVASSPSRTRHTSTGHLPTWDPSPSHSWTRHLSWGLCPSRDPSPGRTRTRHPSGGCLLAWDPSPSHTWTCLLAQDPSLSHTRTRHPSGTHWLAVPGPVSRRHTIRDTSPSRSRSHSWTPPLSEGHHSYRYLSARCSRTRRRSGGRYSDQ